MPKDRQRWKDVAARFRVLNLMFIPQLGQFRQVIFEFRPDER